MARTRSIFSTVRPAAIGVLAAAVAMIATGCTATSSAPATSAVAPIAQQRSAPNGSANGLCFDPNSALAQSALAKLPAAPIGTWSVGQTSNDPISSGCDGLLSWMMADTNTNHPYTQVLLFTGGTYLGTTTSDPYMFTMLTAHTRTSISLTYHWTVGNDPMCCPQGGPSVVSFTLNGTTITANGQFPPHP
ncbi:LppP/LprE family lipoprotein [Nocardia sp. NBC_01327]|uniref:LppP/LprE family lipoprotein n=1 Tax=Nocardia sp. NBC_01327 TaxID=2903593 RepID=UPI002E162FC2|nr:LppP/LprE family lipoprotein [Nocardia sp. NBC_01327]